MTTPVSIKLGDSEDLKDTLVSCLGCTSQKKKKEMDLMKEKLKEDKKIEKEKLEKKREEKKKQIENPSEKPLPNPELKNKRKSVKSEAQERIPNFTVQVIPQEAELEYDPINKKLRIKGLCPECTHHVSSFVRSNNVSDQTLAVLGVTREELKTKKEKKLENPAEPPKKKRKLEKEEIID